MAARFRLADGVLAQTALDHAVLLDSARGDYFELNEVGTIIVRALLDGGDDEVAAERLMQAFDVAAVTARADVAAFIADLLERGLLLRVERDC